MTLSACLAGCATFEPPTPRPLDLQALYSNEKPAAEAPLSGERSDGPRITFPAVDLPLIQFAQRMATDYGVSVVVEDSFASKVVTAEFVDVPLRVVMDTVARRAGMTLHEESGVYFLGSVDRGAKATLVCRVPGIAGEEIKPLIESCMTSEGRSVVLTDGTVVVSDTSQVIDRVRRLVDDLRGLQPGNVALQFFVVAWSDQALREAGVDVLPSASLAANLAAKASGEVTSGLELKTDALAVLRASWERSGVAIVQQPLFFVVDGSEVEFSRRDRIPYVQGSTQTDNNGATVRQTTTAFADVGFKLSAKCRRMNAESLRVDLVVNSSRVTDRFEGVPIVASDDLRQTSVVRAGTVHLVAEFSATSTRRESSNGLPWLASTEETRATYQVFCYPVFVGVGKSSGEATAAQGGRGPLDATTPTGKPIPPSRTVPAKRLEGVSLGSGEPFIR